MVANDSLDAETRVPSSSARQRWRIVYRRTERVADRPQRALEADWLSALEASGLPLAPTGSGSRRPKVVFGPPIPAGAVGERELLDVYLRERLAVAEVRDRLGPAVPEGYDLVDVYDVWVGAPALPAAVVALDYRVELGLDPAAVAETVTALRTAAAALLGAPALPRTRARGGRSREYDLRPFLLDIRVDEAGEDRITLTMRLRVDPAAGAGRPDEVVRALLEATTEPAALAALEAATAPWLRSAATELARAEPAVGGTRTGGWPAATADDAVPPDGGSEATTGSAVGRFEAGIGRAADLPAPSRSGQAFPGQGVRVVRERLLTVDELAGGTGARRGVPEEPDPA